MLVQKGLNTDCIITDRWSEKFFSISRTGISPIWTDWILLLKAHFPTDTIRCDSFIFFLIFNDKNHLKFLRYNSEMRAAKFESPSCFPSIHPSRSFSSVAQSCPTLCDPMNCSTPGLPVHHQLLEFTQTHVHRVGDAIQPSHPLSSPSPPAPNPSQHQSLFQ